MTFNQYSLLSENLILYFGLDISTVSFKLKIDSDCSHVCYLHVAKICVRCNSICFV